MLNNIAMQTNQKNKLLTIINLTDYQQSSPSQPLENESESKKDWQPKNNQPERSWGETMDNRTTYEGASSHEQSSWQPRGSMESNRKSGGIVLLKGHVE